MTGQMAGKCALACASRSINSYDEVALRLLRRRLFLAHPRFLAPGRAPADRLLFLGRLLKKRLPLAPERPAAVSEGRLFAAGRALLREAGGLGFAVPGRLVQDCAEDLAGRCEDDPLLLERPFDADACPLPECLPFFAPFQRDSADGRDPFFLRVSEP